MIVTNGCGKDTDFPSIIVQKSAADWFAKATARPFIFSPSFLEPTVVKSFTDCLQDGVGDEVERVLRVNGKWQCLSLKFLNGGQTLELYASDKLNQPLQLVGTGVNQESTQNSYGADMFVVNDKQRVYPSIPTSVQILPLFATVNRGQLAYVVTMNDGGGAVHIVLEYDQNEIAMIGVNQSGGLELNVFDVMGWQFPPWFGSSKTLKAMRITRPARHDM